MAVGWQRQRLSHEFGTERFALAWYADAQLCVCPSHIAYNIRAEVDYQSSELELTGGVLSHVFDWCYTFCAPTFLCTVEGVSATHWRRNIKDPVAAVLSVHPTLPDGRLEVHLSQDGVAHELSMVRVRAIWNNCSHSFQIIVEDKPAKYDASDDFTMDGTSLRDLETALLEAQRWAVGIQEKRPLKCVAQPVVLLSGPPTLSQVREGQRDMCAGDPYAVAAGALPSHSPPSSFFL